MLVRWTIASLGVTALAALTVTAQMPWLTEPHPVMEVQQTASGEGEGGGPGSRRVPVP